VLDDLTKILSEWWKTIKDNEGLLQVFGKDPAGNVSDGEYIIDAQSSSQYLFSGLHHAWHVL